jgi:hypothetical protein
MYVSKTMPAFAQTNKKQFRTKTNKNSLALIIHLPNQLHLLQMLLRMIRMNHLILHSDIISPEELNDVPAGMDKVGNVVNVARDGDFGGFEGSVSGG